MSLESIVHLLRQRDSIDVFNRVVILPVAHREIVPRGKRKLVGTETLCWDTIWLPYFVISMWYRHLWFGVSALTFDSFSLGPSFFWAIYMMNLKWWLTALFIVDGLRVRLQIHRRVDAMISSTQRRTQWHVWTPYRGKLEYWPSLITIFAIFALAAGSFVRNLAFSAPFVPRGLKTAATDEATDWNGIHGHRVRWWNDEWYRVDSVLGVNTWEIHWFIGA